MGVVRHGKAAPSVGAFGPVGRGSANRDLAFR
jgi:hypothetical protein